MTLTPPRSAAAPASGRSLRRRARENTLDPIVGAVLTELIPAWGDTDAWAARVREYDTFQRVHGRPPTSAGEKDERSLAQWLAQCRTTYRAGDLPSDRIADVETVPGHTWDPRDDLWLSRFAAYRDIMAAGGSAPSVANPDPELRKLGGWLRTNRATFAAGKMSQARVDMFEAVPGHSWDTFAEAWKQSLALYRTILVTTGRPPPQKSADPKVAANANWVAICRWKYRKGALAPERVAELEGVFGHEWEPHATSWRAGADAYREWMEKHDGIAPRRHAPDEAEAAIGRWLASARTMYRRGGLPTDRITELEAIRGHLWVVRGKPIRSAAERTA